jgi:hypothetical protein
MFEIRISEEAQALVLAESKAEGFARPGLMIHRQGPVGEVTRLPSGKASWSVERPHAWRARVGDFQTIEDTAEDVYVIEGIRVWLGLVPRPGEAGVSVVVRESQLHVEALGEV